MNEPEFLKLDEVLQIHSRSLAEHGVFLARNGLYVSHPAWELYKAMIAIARKELTKGRLADLLRKDFHQEFTT